MKAGQILDWRVIGAELATVGDNEQAAFFNAFMNELKHGCGTHFATQMQMEFIRKKLDERDREDYWSQLGLGDES